jgi:putative DNA methylase
VTVNNRQRKLIEVALPLDEINSACKADKDRKTGTIRNLHKWFAPMPLPAWRALLFAALVDDPEDDNQRVYLLDLIKRLVENGADLPDEETLDEAKALLEKQFPDGLPAVMDPFCGGGSTLVEAQRLGLSTEGSDLNPVPVLISRTLTSVLPSVSDIQPCHPLGAAEIASAEPAHEGYLFSDERGPFTGFDGLARDVEYHAERIRRAALERLASVFPETPDETPVAWLWARTVPCTNPACGIETILTTTWWLSKKKGDLAWIEPYTSGDRVVLDVRSAQRSGSPQDPPKVGRGASFSCVACAQIVAEEDVRTLAESGRMGLRMVAVATEIDGRRRYRAPSTEEERAAAAVQVPEAVSELSLGPANRYVTPPQYGLTEFRDLYTPRQLLTINTFAQLVAETPSLVREEGGSEEWAKAVTTILGLAVGQLARFGSSLCQWRLRATANSKAEAAFSRADIPMMWDFAETYFDGGSVGDWTQICKSITRAFPYITAGKGTVVRRDAREAVGSGNALVATDPPYFDAIGYADLSDYFYMWHRIAFRSLHPDLYHTIAAPKSGELTAFPWRNGGTKETAREYFIEGFTETFKSLQQASAPTLPLLVVYASKEQKGGREEETRWSSILTAIIDAGLEITGTWPIHGTGSTRMRGIGSNAVATYIVMICRPRKQDAVSCTLADFNRALRRELGPAVRDLQAASILPVDLAQAAMGPGMQVYSRYRAVLDQSGNRVLVDKALRLINVALAEVLDEQEGELDPESRFAVRWWETYAWDSAPFGEADKTARPLGIGVDDVVRARVITSQGNRVQLLGAGSLDETWVPSADVRPTAWEAVHHLAHRLIDRGGELESARLMGVLGELQDPAMALVYRLHDIAAKKGRRGDQERYNALINSWTELVKLSATNSTMRGLF